VLQSQALEIAMKLEEYPVRENGVGMVEVHSQLTMLNI
jgi:hypothetical protein